MSIEMKDKALNEKFSQVSKAIEIIGGNKYLGEVNDKEQKVLDLIINNVFSSDNVGIEVFNRFYTFHQLLKLKTEYEKNFLKNKSTTINSIIYKVKKYDTSLDSKIRKYKKTRFVEEYTEIFNIIGNRYRRDINLLVLNMIPRDEIENIAIEDENNLYGDYLLQKRKQIIDSVFSKLGIV